MGIYGNLSEKAEKSGMGTPKAEWEAEK